MTAVKDITPAAAKPARHRQWMLRIFVLALLLALAFMLLAYHNVMDQSDTINTSVNEMRSQNMATQTAVEDFKRQVKQVLQLDEQNLKIVGQQQQQLDTQVKALVAERDSSNEPWLLAELDNLLGLAERKLQFEHDKKTAVALLETASKRLTKLTDPKFLALKQAVATDLQTAKGLPDVDVMQLAIEVSALEKVADQLPLLSDSLLTAHAAQQPAPNSDNAATWRERMAQSTHEFISLIQVREQQQLSNIFLTADQEKLVRLFMQSKLNLLQTLVLHEQFSGLSTVVADLNQLIIKYYMTDGAAVKGFQQSLQKFANTDFQVKWPDLQRSIQQLQKVMVK